MMREVRNIFGASEDDHDGYVIIPADHIRQRVVPIFIRCKDDYDNRVYPGWLEAVQPIARGLRFLAKRILRDEWKVSELTEGSVHMLSRRHSERLGRSPSAQIFVDAKWRALDMAVGGRRARALRDIDLYDEALLDMTDPSDFAQDFENRDLVARLQRLLTASGKTDILKMMQMCVLDAQDEIAKAFGIPEGPTGYQAMNRLRKRFWRTMRRLLEPSSDPANNQRVA